MKCNFMRKTFKMVSKGMFLKTDDYLCEIPIQIR